MRVVRVPAALSPRGLCGGSAVCAAAAEGASGVSAPAGPARLRLVRLAFSAPAFPSIATDCSSLVGLSGQCAREMVQCESCWALVPSVEQPAPESDGRTDSDGVSACRRCGFLSVERASVRSLLQLPPRRDADGTVRLLLAASRRVGPELTVVAAAVARGAARGGRAAPPAHDRPGTQAGSSEARWRQRGRRRAGQRARAASAAVVRRAPSNQTASDRARASAASGARADELAVGAAVLLDHPAPCTWGPSARAG